RRDSFEQCVSPQVAHQAAPRTFAISQKNCGDRNDLARLRPLLFYHEGIGPLRVERISRWPPPHDPGIPFTWQVGIWRDRLHRRELLINSQKRSPQIALARRQMLSQPLLFDRAMLKAPPGKNRYLQASDGGHAA